MSTHDDAFRDSITMLRRSLKRMLRYPSSSLLVVGLPVILLLLFVEVFGGTMGAGLGIGSGGRAVYVNYVVPGIILVAIAGVAQGTAIAVSMDMADGIIARFRTMGIARGAVLTGHVLASTIQTMLGLVLVVGVALAIGFRPDGTPAEWAAAIGLLTGLTLAVTWLSAALGLHAKSVEGASNVAMPLFLLVLLGSGFAPTDSMPAGLRGFAEVQPFTSVTETLRGLLMGSAIGQQAVLAVAWCAAIGLLGYVWAMRLYDRDPARQVRLLSGGHA
ncbi:MAG TPA: ABC transporter permease [Actinomycetota bacterium]|nr:ABC transporter permease [Actinomycetota bacterium]